MADAPADLPADVTADVTADVSADAPADLPEAAVRRLDSSAFSSGLTVPDFAACLDLGLEPVGLVQGFCVMRWGWYGSGSGYMRGMNPYTSGQQTPGSYS